MKYIRFENKDKYNIKTPYFVFSEKEILKNIDFIRNLNVPLTFLYSTKSLPNGFILSLMKEKVDGFSVSSIFEGKIAKSYLKNIHYISPVIKEDEIEKVSTLCHRITLNSLSQFNLLKDKTNSSLGLRINPEISFIKDKKYDPSRRDSKLGIPISSLGKIPKEIEGIHFHNNCDSLNLKEFVTTIKTIEKKINLRQIKWFNLGGGYIFSDKTKNIDLFIKAIKYLKSTYDFEIIIEPGASLVRNSGKLVSSIVDIVENKNEKIAILDTSVNHLPEVFEYQFEPDILEHKTLGRIDYILAGRTCLAGDLFGKYAFDKELKRKDRITFKDVGSYSLPKLHMFNGVNLPSIYLLKDGILEEMRKYSFLDYSNIYKEIKCTLNH